MKKLEFKPEDFPGDIYSEVYTEISQALFDAWYAKEIGNAPVVYGTTRGPGFWSTTQDGGFEEYDTHTAKLICIEEIR